MRRGMLITTLLSGALSFASLGCEGERRGREGETQQPGQRGAGEDEVERVRGGEREPGMEPTTPEEQRRREQQQQRDPDERPGPDFLPPDVPAPSPGAAARDGGTGGTMGTPPGGTQTPPRGTQPRQPDSPDER